MAVVAAIAAEGRRRHIFQLVLVAFIPFPEPGFGLGLAFGDALGNAFGFGLGDSLLLFLVVGFHGEYHMDQLRVQLQEHGQGQCLGGDAGDDDGSQQFDGRRPELQGSLFIQSPKGRAGCDGIVEQGGGGDGGFGEPGRPGPPGRQRFQGPSTPC